MWLLLGVHAAQATIATGSVSSKLAGLQVTYIIGIDFTKKGAGKYREPHGPAKLHIDDKVVAEADIRTIYTRYGLSGAGLCVGYDGGDAVSSQYKPKFEFTGGRVIKVVFDVADDVYADVEQHFAAAMARD